MGASTPADTGDPGSNTGWAFRVWRLLLCDVCRALSRLWLRRARYKYPLYLLPLQVQWPKQAGVAGYDVGVGAGTTTRPADMLFVLDGSQRVTPQQWQLLQQWLNNTVQSWRVGPSGVQV